MPEEKTDGPDEDWIELADAIGMVRRQLSEAAAKKPAEGPMLSVRKVTLEFSGELKRSASGAAGVRFWVASADVKGERSQSAGQKVTVELQPIGDGYEVSNRVDALSPE